MPAQGANLLGHWGKRGRPRKRSGRHRRNGPLLFWSTCPSLSVLGSQLCKLQGLKSLINIHSTILLSSSRTASARKDQEEGTHRHLQVLPQDYIPWSQISREDLDIGLDFLLRQAQEVILEPVPITQLMPLGVPDSLGTSAVKTSKETRERQTSI